ncbi:MAG: hypothetical protein ACRELE_02610 [Gemmatimonadales bacterium]
MTTPSPRADPLALAFAPLHKRGMGTAVGVAAALVTFLLTAIPLVRGKASLIELDLLAQYFRGYSETWTGAVIGAAWAAFVGFVLGWFLAFCSNFVLAVRLLTLRARAEYAQTRDFLDHI